MLVRDVMVESVLTVTPEQTLRDALELLQSKRIRQVPVLEDGRLVGIITDRDIKRATPSILSHIDRAEYDGVLDQTLVRQLMTREPMTITPDAPLKSAVKIFISRKVGALPVLEDGVLVGLITQADALRVLYDMLEE
ncbi:MAG TPA: CBS domain-containing protein [Thermoanaerobaculia bacterium]|nr:CBS domain-containing protein [Thermoanaerobaculia bacterium]